jgi:hypothetical protein
VLSRISCICSQTDEIPIEFTCKMCYVKRNSKSLLAAGRKRDADMNKQAAKATSQTNPWKNQRDNAWYIWCIRFFVTKLFLAHTWH